MSNLFKSKQVTPQYDVAMDPYGSIRKPTLDWLSGQIGKPAEQYPGQIVAPMSEQEKGSFDWLRKYTDQPPSEGFSLAKEEVRKTMQDEYDPTSSPFYQSVKAEAAKNLADVQSDIADKAAGGGRYWTGARLGEQRESATDYGLAMNKLLYGMAETERGRRLDTAPFAAQLGEYETMQPLQKATALQSLGALPRTISQATNEAAYNEWLRANYEYPLQIGSMATGLSREPYYAQRVKQPSPIAQSMSDLMNKFQFNVALGGKDKKTT